MDYQLQGIRSRGRPRRRWQDQSSRNRPWGIMLDVEEEEAGRIGITKEFSQFLYKWQKLIYDFWLINYSVLWRDPAAI
jgi:hypothetical protein